MYSIRRNVLNELRNNYPVQNLIAIAIKMLITSPPLQRSPPSQQDLVYMVYLYR